MKFFRVLFFLFSAFVFSQNIKSIQLFNPQTNDETPVIKFGEQLVLSFDDLENKSTVYRYTIKHFNRNWQEDGLFFTEYAKGPVNSYIQGFKYSFNTVQRYTHYTLAFPNEKTQLKISGNYEIIVFNESVLKPIFKKRFCVVENGASLAINVTRFADSKKANLNQRVEVIAVSNKTNVFSNLNSLSLNIIQNNNFGLGIYNQKPNSAIGTQLIFQQMNLVFPGNNEFYYFDNKNMNQPFDMVAAVENNEEGNHTYLHSVWAFPLNYQYQPDVNGAFYFRRNDLGIERSAETEADYSWVYFTLDSEKTEKEIFVLGAFNDFIPSKENQMFYDENSKKYTAKIFLKQGFYNYILATKDTDGNLDLGDVNGNFWQTENLYQGFLYYTPFSGNYDGLVGYGETRGR